MPEHEVTFGTLGEDGKLSNVRKIWHSDIGRCPFVIFTSEHYRADGSCRCDDPDHAEMAEWGYVWDGKRRAAPPDEEEER